MLARLPDNAPPCCQLITAKGDEGACPGLQDAVKGRTVNRWVQAKAHVTGGRYAQGVQYYMTLSRELPIRAKPVSGKCGPCIPFPRHREQRPSPPTTTCQVATLAQLTSSYGTVTVGAFLLWVYGPSVPGHWVIKTWCSSPQGSDKSTQQRDIAKAQAMVQLLKE